MTKSERDDLAARYESMAANGLVDVKYLVTNAGEATTEQVCGEVNALYEALARHEYKPFDLGTLTISK
jgi:hypothetical protein